MKFDKDQLDALTEVVNIGVGRAAASLSALVEQRIELSVPCVQVCSLSELNDKLDARGECVDSSVVQGFAGRINGRAMLAFPQRSGVELAKLLGEEEIQGETSDADALEFDLAGILEEIGNIVLNGVLGSLANVFSDDFQYSVPELCSGPAFQALLHDVSSAPIGEAPTCLLANTRFEISDSEISGSLLLAFNTDELGVLLTQLLTTAEA